MTQITRILTLKFKKTVLIREIRAKKYVFLQR